MLDYSQYRYQLRILTNRQKKNSKFYKDLIKQARKENKTKEEIEDLSNEDSFEYFSTQEDIDVLITNYLCKKADTLFVPLPDRDDKEMWGDCFFSSRKKVLTTRGINAIKVKYMGSGLEL